MNSPNVREERYEGNNREEAEAVFRRDAQEAAQHGWTPVVQKWWGSTLMVSYERVTSRWADTSRDAPRGGTDLNLPAVGMILGGALVVVGFILPWITISSGFLSLTRNGRANTPRDRQAAIGPSTVLASRERGSIERQLSASAGRGAHDLELIPEPLHVVVGGLTLRASLAARSPVAIGLRASWRESCPAPGHDAYRSPPGPSSSPASGASS